MVLGVVPGPNFALAPTQLRQVPVCGAQKSLTFSRHPLRAGIFAPGTSPGRSSDVSALFPAHDFYVKTYGFHTISTFCHCTDSVQAGTSLGAQKSSKFSRHPPCAGISTPGRSPGGPREVPVRSRRGGTRCGPGTKFRPCTDSASAGTSLGSPEIVEILSPPPLRRHFCAREVPGRSPGGPRQVVLGVVLGPHFALTPTRPRQVPVWGAQISLTFSRHPPCADIFAPGKSLGRLREVPGTRFLRKNICTCLWSRAR